MDFEYDINDVLKSDYIIYAISIITLIYVFYQKNIEVFTKFVDSIYGRAIMLMLVIWLLSEEHYTIAICTIIVIIHTLYWRRERNDYNLVKYTINKDTSSSKNGKCSREGVRYPEAEREVPGPQNDTEFHSL